MIAASRRLNTWRVVGATLLWLLVASCGIPDDSAPRTIATSRLPAAAERPEIVTALGGDAVQFRIFVVGADDRLTTVSRQVPRPPDPLDIINLLLIGPNPVERAQGLYSALTERAGIGNVDVDEALGVAYVDLSAGSLGDSVATEQQLAFGQIVLSLTNIPSIRRVEITRGGELLQVPLENGTSEPGQQLRRSDFAWLNDTAPIIGFVDEDPTPGPAPVIERPVTTESPGTDLFVWMLQPSGTELLPVERRADPSADTLLRRVLEGVTPNESARGITSALNEVDGLEANVDVNETTDTAIVDLPPGVVPDLASGRQKLAVAQIVFSLTSLYEVTSVSFSEAGVPVSYDTDRGLSALGQPLTRNDYITLSSLANEPVTNTGVLSPAEAEAFERQVELDLRAAYSAWLAEQANTRPG